MSRSTAKTVFVIYSIVVIILSFLLFGTGNLWSIFLLIVLAQPFSIYLAHCMRCKHCGRWPRKGDFSLERCPRCDHRLE